MFLLMFILTPLVEHKVFIAKSMGSILANTYCYSCLDILNVLKVAWN